MVVLAPREEEDGKMDDTIIGVNLAKSVFQLHGATVAGEVLFCKKLSRAQLRQFMSDYPAALVVFEACGSASYWAREMTAFGHQVKLIAPQYVRPFVKRQKNDTADAEAIVIAARQPEMRFTLPKTEGQQTKTALFRSRERLVHQRTEIVNAVRSMLYEFGHVFPIGIAQLKRIEALIGAPDCGLPRLIIQECEDLLAQISEQTKRIDEKPKSLKSLASQTDVARHLQTMPGVGPPVALAVEAFAPDMAQFENGRAFAAWLGLVPGQFSSGGKQRLGRISKAGQADIRRLLIIGAMSRMNWLGQRTIAKTSWLDRMLARKPKLLVAVALANKMARQIWVMLTREEDYQDPVMSAA